MGGGVSTNHKSSNRIELSWFSQHFLNFYCFDLIPPINPPTHPPTHHTIHPPMGGEFFRDFKSSNGIEISWLVQALSNFNWFQGSIPWGSGRWVDGGGGGYGCVGVSHAHTLTHMHMHACTCMLNMINMLNMDASVGGHLQFYTCVCMHVHACMCMWGHTPCPQMPRDTPHPPAPSPELQGGQNTKIQ